MNEAPPNASATDRAPADDEPGLREALTGDRRDRRDAAMGLVALAESGLSPDTRAALADRIREDTDADVRQFAVEALGVDGAAPAAIDIALDDAEPWVRAEAAVAFSRAAPDRVERLADALDDPAPWVRRNALIALAKTGAADRDTLVDTLKTDPHPAVREYAAQYLPDTDGDDAEAVRLLAAVLAREPNAFVRVKAAAGLGELATDRAIEALETQGLGDRSDDVVRTARHALARARGTDPEAIEVPGPDPPGGGPGREAHGRGPSQGPPGAEGRRGPPGGGRP